MSGTQGPQAHGASGVDDTLKDFWATRPRRPRRGRKIAGVAAGIGNRYGIDPIIVRVAFVVATFYGGAGVLIYLLGWLLLPEQDDEVAPLQSMVGQGRSSTSTAFTLVLCLALIPAAAFFFDSTITGILGLLVIGGALVLLHRSRGHLGQQPQQRSSSYEPTPGYGALADMPIFGPTGPRGTTQPLATPTQPGQFSADQPAADQPTGPISSDGSGRAEQPTGPPAWDPLGAAPFAWDLPEPDPSGPEPPAARGRSKVGLMTFGTALATAGVLALLSPYVEWLHARHIVGIVLGVIGFGLVFGAFARGGRGLIGLAVPLAVVGIGLTAISPNGYRGVGDVTVRPATIEQVDRHYERTAGTVNLDLTALPSSGHVETTVDLDVGDVTVIVPPTADVELTCEADVGDIDCLGRTVSGPDSEIDVVDNGADGTGGLRIELSANVGAGSVEVRRG